MQDVRRSKIKLLIIEDDPYVAEAISLCFEMRWPGSIITIAHAGKKGVELVETESPEVVLLDIKLPDIDGFEVLRQIRLFSDVPVIIITVEGQEVQRVKGLESGADDYIVKPISYIELLARVKAVLRRSQMLEPQEGEAEFADDNLLINFANREVRLEGELVKLTPTELRILRLLVRQKGQLVTKRKLMQQVWGEDYIENTDYLRTYIRRLRNKLRDNPPRRILTEQGLGYRFIGHI